LNYNNYFGNIISIVTLDSYRDAYFAFFLYHRKTKLTSEKLNSSQCFWNFVCLSELKFEVINLSSLKTSYFGLKPGKWLIFKCPDLKVGAIDMRDNQGFSHINEIY